MKYYIMEQQQTFTCVGSSCPNTCCVGWKVVVDEKTDEYYRSTDGTFGTYLNDNIDRSGPSPIMKLHDSRCACLDENNLCMIYQNLGEEHLCDVCKLYPRVPSLVGGILFLPLVFSCPEVVRIVFTMEKRLEFLSCEDELVWKVPPDFDGAFFSILMQSLTVGINLLQDRSLTITRRQRLFLLMNKSVQDALDAGKREEAKDLLDLFSTPEAYQALEAEESSLNLTEKIRLLSETSLLFSAPQLFQNADSDLTANLFWESVRWLHESDTHLRQGEKNLAVLNEGRYSIEQEHLLTYLTFRHFTDTMSHKSLFWQAVFTVAFNQFQRLFTAFRDGEGGSAIPSLAWRTLSVSRLSRFLEHNTFFPTLFYELICGKGLDNLETMYQIIS